MFDASNLSALAYANGFTQWHYLTSDGLMDIITEGYFDSASFYMKPGDMIIVNFDRDMTPEGYYYGHRVGFIYLKEGKYTFGCC